MLSDYWMILFGCAALEFGLKKSSSCGPNFLCYVGGASAGVIFHPVSDNLKFFLVVNTSEDQWRPFSEDFDGIRPLKRLICPLILWTKFFTKMVLLPLKKVRNWTEFGPFRCCQRLKNRLLDRVVFGLLGSQI